VVTAPWIERAYPDDDVKVDDMIETQEWLDVAIPAEDAYTDIVLAVADANVERCSRKLDDEFKAKAMKAIALTQLG